MKKNISFTLVAILSTLSLFAQNIEIETIADINSFNYETVDNLYIHNTTGLGSIYGFESLKVVRKDLIISGNEITSLTGFDNLITVSGNLIIEDNELLSSVNAFHKLEFVGKRFCLSGIISNEITGFSSLTQVLEVTISNCRLKNLNFLNQLESAETGIEISENDSLLNIDSFSNITVTGYVKILNNNSLVSLQGFSSLESTLSIYISNNASLISFSGLEMLKTVSSYVLIWRNPVLVSLNALENLTLIEGDLSIFDNSSLSGCTMIRGLLTTPDAIKGNVEIYGNKPTCNYENMYTIIPATTGQRIAIYPNPSRDKTIFDVGNTNYTLQIYNISGHIVHSYKNLNSPLTIEWNDNQQGLYFYQVSSEYREIQSGKIIVE